MNKQEISFFDSLEPGVVERVGAGARMPLAGTVGLRSSGSVLIILLAAASAASSVSTDLLSSRLLLFRLGFLVGF